MVTIELAGGLFVTDAALATAIGLEFRGHVLTVKDGQLFVSQASKLTEQDRASIKVHRRHLMAIAEYRVPQ